MDRQRSDESSQRFSTYLDELASVTSFWRRITAVVGIEREYRQHQVTIDGHYFTPLLKFTTCSEFASVLPMLPYCPSR